MSGRQSSQKPEPKPLPNSNGKATVVLSQLAAEPGHPKVTIDEALHSANVDLPKDSVHVSHEELRKNFKVRVSGDLARGLWYLLGFVVVAHLITTIAFSWRLSNQPNAGDDDDKRIDRIEKATATVTDTSKTLYAVLGVLTTAVTGYYFTSGANSTTSDGDGEKDS
jgi:hypothetical protein